LKLQELVKNLNIQCDTNLEISGLNTLKNANQNQISFLENKKYAKDLQDTNAGAVFVTQEMQNNVPKGTIALVCQNPYISLAKLSKYFAPEIIDLDDVEPVIGLNCIIAPHVYIGKGSIIGDNCTLMPGVFVGDNVKIGCNCTLYPNVSIYRDCVLGDDVMIHAGSVVGSDGFGFANENGKYIKIYQNGNVTVGNDVEIGSNTSIDRAAFESTIIEDGVRIDNLVHIAHNCVIGRGSIITGQCGFAGSSVLKEYVIMGAQSGVAGHLEIAPFTTISAKSGVTKTITEPKKQWAGFPLMEHRTWLKLQGKIAKLLKG
jgi:UDP-3-O-[3-hydroxymyristoyl] glucosamine N-acyltransferase